MFKINYYKEKIKKISTIVFLMLFTSFCTVVVWVQNILNHLIIPFDLFFLPVTGMVFLISAIKIYQNKNKKFWFCFSYCITSIQIQGDWIMDLILPKGSLLLYELTQFIPVFYLTAHFFLGKKANIGSLINFLILAFNGCIYLLLDGTDISKKQAIISCLLSNPMYIIILHFIINLKQRSSKIEALNEDLTEKLEKDVLTGIFNRFYLNKKIQADTIQLENGKKNPLTMLMIDIDHFKRINDTLGHSIGDEVLKKVAQKIKSVTRENDFCARWGGEEFVMVINNSNIENIYLIANRILNEVKEIYPGGELPNVTVSIGIASRKDNELAKDLMELADKSLYVAKQSGRNKYVYSD